MKKYFHVILVLLSLCLSSAISLWMLSNPVKAIVENKKMLPKPVSIELVKARGYIASVQAFGKVVPYWKTDIVSAVSGRLIELTPDFDAGKRVPAGGLLAKVEDVEYRSETATRQRELADARLAYVQEQRKVAQAKKDWLRMGHTGLPASPLVLRKPQLDAAFARVRASQEALAKAQNDYQNTNIVAPYDAAIIERKVALGSYVTKGDVVGRVYGTSRMEIRFPLTEQQCSLLNLDDRNSKSRFGTKVSLVSVTDSRDIWIGTLTGMDLQISDATRQRIAIVSVKNPLDCNHPLLPGTFVRAVIPGKSLQDTLAIPESSVTQDGYIWYVDNNNLLRNMKPEIRFRRSGKVFVQATTDMASLNVVVRPLKSYLAGTAVTPRQSEFSNE